VAFADEEDGVVAIKHGDEILYASLYNRARFGVNFLARVHYLTPTLERDATAWEDVEFTDSGMVYTRDGRKIEAQTSRYEKMLPDLEQALEGEKLPIAKLPPAVQNFRPGQENGYAGKGDFYRLRYGNYLIGMNMTQSKTFTLKPPTNAPATAMELIGGKSISLTTPIKVGPRSTVILYLPDAAGH